MTQLREQMIKAMELRDFAKKTITSYLKMVENLAIYYNKSPDILTQEEIEDFIIYLMNEKKMASSSINVYTVTNGEKVNQNHRIKIYHSRV